MRNIIIADPQTCYSLCAVLAVDVGQPYHEVLQAAIDKWQASTLGDCVLDYYPHQTARPAFFVAHDETHTVVLVEGTGFPGEAIAYAAPQSTGWISPEGERVNHTFYDVADKVLHLLDGQGLIRGHEVTLVGHSYGAGIVTCMARKLVAAGFTRRLQLLTFGSPRCGDAAFVSNTAKVLYQRWMLEGDPVPFLPPHSDEAPPTAARTIVNLFPWMNEYEQLPGAFIIARDGTVQAREYPPSTPVRTDETFLEYVGLLIEAASEFHSLTNFVPRLAARAAASNQRGLELVTRLKNNLPSGMSSVTQSRINKKGLGVTMAARWPLSFNPTIVRMTPTQWVVVWMQRTIASGRTFGRCKVLVKKLRWALQRFAVCDQIEGASLKLSLADFLVGAASGAPGWDPFWNIT
jgi:pimeloyl-ACP methyl ester carboxylesterase